MRIGPVALSLAALAVLFVATAAGVGAGYYWSNHTNAQGDIGLLIKRDVAQNAEHIRQAKQQADQQLTALTVRMAELQARLMRLDALGERLVSVAKLKGGEFDFSQAPAVGGPSDSPLDQQMDKPNFIAELDQLARDVETREQQLEVLESLLENRKLRKEVSLAGRPVTWGWLSSRYGRRTDPFTGRLAWHAGVDFAGKEGSDIISVGGGVVTWAGERYGYGLMVEVNHGSGLTTRYAHAKEVMVNVGDIVKQGQALAKMGSTGRSTGPHVHFEVLKNGKTVDPTKYTYRPRS